LNTSTSHKNLQPTKEVKRSQLYSQIMKSERNDYLYDLKKKAGDVQSIKNSSRCMKSVNESGNYEVVNTPNNMYFEQYKKRLNKGSIIVGDSKEIDFTNYTTTNQKANGKKYLTKKTNLVTDVKSCAKKAKKMKINSRNTNVITSAKNNISRKSNFLPIIERKNSTSGQRKKLMLKQQNFKKIDSEANYRQVQTARVNLSHVSSSPSRFQSTQKVPSGHSTKYGYLGQRDHHKNSMRQTSNNSKIMVQNMIPTTATKMNSSRTEKHSKSKEQKSVHRSSSKRKKSKCKEPEPRGQLVDKLKGQILDYLDVYIKQDGDEAISDELYSERLIILKEFLCYLEEK
jgi:hypothetical protein